MIAVIFGGKSNEHTISVATGVQAFLELRKNYDVMPIYIDKNGVWRSGKINERPILKNLKRGKEVKFISGQKVFLVGCRKYRIECAILCLHGLNGEDGSVQGLLKSLGIPFSGSDVFASAICLDKEGTKRVLSSHKIPQISYTVVQKRDWEEDNECEKERILQLGYPVIIKPARCGSSIGISIAKNENQLEKSMQKAFDCDIKVVVEHALTSFVEVNCAVLKNGEEYFVSDVEQPKRKGEILDYNDKYAFGAKLNSHLIPAPIGAKNTAKVKQLALKAFRALSCAGIARIDFLISEEGKVYLNEINTIPGTLATYLFPTLKFSASDILQKLITDAIYEDEKRNSVNYNFSSELYACK